MTVTYNGTTAASTVANAPVVISAGIGVVGNSPGLTGARLWFYTSTNTAADLSTPASFSDGAALGMKAGDVVLGITSSAGGSTPILFLAPVGLVTASSGASLSSNVLTSTAV